MNIEQLNEGKELLKLIETTQNALDNLVKMKPEERDSQRVHDDKLFRLNISEWNDGSGNRADLHRYCGNKELVDVIINELYRQLNDFKDKFASL